MDLTKSVKDAAFSAAVTTVLHYLEKDPEANLSKAMRVVDQAVPEGWYAPERAAIRRAIEEKGNWYQLILKIFALDDGVRKTFLQNFMVNASLKGSAGKRKWRRKSTATCPGPFCWIPPPRATCAVPAAGRRSTVIT